MKISGLVIQKRNISESTENCFHAIYKGKRIYITTNHGFGWPKYSHLSRYMIDVIDIKTGLKDVESFEDCHTIEDAIRKALYGCCLLAKPQP